MARVAPLLNKLTQEVLYDEVWERPLISQRERRLITLAVLITQGRTQSKGHMKAALDNGLSVEELGEAITHLAFYAGWPAAVNAARWLLELVEEQEAAAAGDEAG